MKFLIAGLGNPGPEYELTRHNAGFLVIDRIADLQEIKMEQGRHGEFGEGRYKGRIVQLLKPNTYMNLSGKAVNYWLQEGAVKVSNLIVVTDDLALPFGTLRIRAKGSDGGHNGLKSINAALGTQDYPRLRFGIGNRFSKGKQVDYVLGQWDDEEAKMLEELVDKAAKAVLLAVSAGINNAMNQFNN
jgi:peptidyl-tRNA hydrolase, PTH1 family